MEKSIRWLMTQNAFTFVVITISKSSLKKKNLGFEVDRAVTE